MKSGDLARALDLLRRQLAALERLASTPPGSDRIPSELVARLEQEAETLAAETVDLFPPGAETAAPPPRPSPPARSARRPDSGGGTEVGLFEQIPGIFWTTDTELRFTFSSGADLVSLDLAAGEVVGQTLFEFFGTEDREFLPIASHVRALRGERSQYELFWSDRTFSVQLIPLRDDAGAVVAISGAALDITERKAREDKLKLRHDELEARVKERTVMLTSAVTRMEKELAERLQAEAALRKGRARYRAIVEDQTELICRFLPDFTLTFVNQACGRSFDRPHDELIGESFLTFIAEEDREDFKKRNRSLDHDSSTITADHRVVKPDSRIGWQQWTVRMLFDENDRFIEYQAVGRDVTELRAAQARVMQAERLAAIGEVVTGLAHESRNALQRSQACLERLALRVKNQPGTAELITGIQNAQDHLHQLYEAVRSYASPINLKPTPCDLGEVLREAWSHLARLKRGRTAKLMEESRGEDLRLVADAFSLQQVMRNVLENSLTACPDPVQIRVRWRENRLNGRPSVTCSILDNGPGLSQEAREKVFDPFYTTKTQGTGLGMAIARRIVEAHGGRISAAGVEGEGAEILITLPRSGK